MIRRYNGVVQRAKFRVGLIQMACSTDPNENLAKAEWRIREAAGRGAQIICLQELFRSQYFCREENARAVRPGRADPRTHQRGVSRGWRAELGVVIIGSLFERRAAGVYHNTAAGDRCRWNPARHVPQDAHPGRPALLREVLLHAGRPGLPQLRYAFRPRGARWCAGTSGIRRRPGWPRWAARRCSSTRPRSAGTRPRKAEYGAAQHDAWRTIQRAHAIANGVYVAAVNRVGYEGPPEHGLEFWGGSFVADPFGVDPGRRLARSGRDPDRGVRPAPHRGRPPQLAVPARPPHRRLRADSEAGDRLKSEHAARARLPHARRVGAARSHLDRLASQSRRLAGPVRPDPVGLRRIVRKLGAVERVRILVDGLAVERQARKILATPVR